MRVRIFGLSIVLSLTLSCISIFSYFYLQNYEKAIYELLLGVAIASGLGELVK